MSKIDQAFERAYAEVVAQDAGAAESCSIAPGYSSVQTARVSDGAAQAAATGAGELLSDAEEAALKRFQRSFGLSPAGQAMIQKALQLPRDTRENRRAICAVREGRAKEAVNEGGRLVLIGEAARNEHAIGTGAVVVLAGLLDLFSSCEPE